MSGRPRAAKSAARSKSASVQKPKPAPARPKPAKKPAARAAPAPAAAAPPAPTEPTLRFHVVTTAQRRTRTLAMWREQKYNAAYFVKYEFTATNEETGEQVPVWTSAFTVRHTGLNGGLRTLEDAVYYAKRAWLSRVKDDSEVWEDPDAAALKERSREIISNPDERQNNGFTRNLRPGAWVQVRASGQLDVVSYRQQDGAQVRARRSIDEDALSSLEAKLRVSDPQLVGCVQDFAADISSMPSDEQHKLLWDRAQTLHEIVVALAQTRADDFKRRVADDFEVGRAEFEEDVGFDEDVKADLSREGRPVTSLMDVDDFPRACLLGDADHCPIHDKIMEWFYLSERRNATRGVQGRVPLLYSRHHLLLTIGGRPRQGPLPEVY